MSRFPEFELSRINPQSIQDRSSKVRVEEFARAPEPEASFRSFFDSLPHILAGESLRQAVSAIAAAHRAKKPVIVSMGAHVLKCGLGPVIVDLIQRRIITCLAMNGAGAIHDAELALYGATSEDVVAGLKDGSFGMAQETADFVNGASIEARETGQGFGETVGRILAEGTGPHREVSVLAACSTAGIPATLHVGIGTDIIHMHPSADGAAIGEASHRDFRILVGCLESLNGGGVLMNIGSAVILPEVILKGFAILRNAGLPLDDFTSINLDFIQQYRSGQQVVIRTGQLGARGIALTGHHEIMLPLIAHAVIAELSA